MNPRTQTTIFDLQRLASETSVQHIEYHDSLASTNSTAVELLEPLLQHAPAIVLTAEQTAGKGRKGNLWWSSAGALTFTLILDSAQLPVDASRRPLISLAAGLAVRDALQSQLPGGEFLVKWPNDVLTESQKVCGILVEQYQTESSQAVLIGIGVNVNNSLAGAPSEIAHRATSLFDLNGQSFDMTTVLISILQRLDFRIMQLVSQPRLALSDLNRYSVLNGRLISLQLPDKTFTGTCLGIDEDGQLVLQSPTGLFRCTSGIVSAW